MKTRTRDNIQVGDLTFQKWIGNQQIRAKISNIADTLRPVYEEKDLVVIGVLNGAVYFTIDLLRALGIAYRLDFIQASSYIGTKSSGKVDFTPIKEKIEGAEVLIIEDIVDSGRTMTALKSHLQAQNPSSLKVVSLFYKPDADVFNQKPDFIGFSIPNDFILGYGLDYNGLGRELEDVYKLHSED